MPTGYTSNIDENTSFEDFVLTCATAFGACAHQRDDSDNSKPKLDKASTYHSDRIIHLEKELNEVESLSIEKCNKLAFKEVEDEVNSCEESLEKNREKILQYKNLCDKVLMWIPPTDEHKKLKQFAVDQLTRSIEFDNMTKYYNKRIKELNATFINGDAWKKKKINNLKESIQNARESHDDEIQRTNERNEWILTLYKSLGKDHLIITSS